MTLKDMCEHIVKADILRGPGGAGVPPTAEQIFNYSPSGELSAVFDWYEMACCKLGENGDGSAYRKRIGLTQDFDWIREGDEIPDGATML